MLKKFAILIDFEMHRNECTSRQRLEKQQQNQRKCTKRTESERMTRKHNNGIGTSIAPTQSPHLIVVESCPEIEAQQHQPNQGCSPEVEHRTIRHNQI
jgi:hypothetical protein